MDQKARQRAYDEMVKNPMAFLERHYGLTPSTDRERIQRVFTEFAGATGVSMDTIAQAIDDFIQHRTTHPFVLQAASAEQSCAYARV